MAATNQFLSTPAKLPKLWQSNLHSWNAYHSSQPDMAQAGWRKWAGEYPDWYASKASSSHPNWFRRTHNTIRRADYEKMTWHYDLASKPTSRTHDQFISYTGEVIKADTTPGRILPPNRSYTGSVVHPQPFPREQPTPNFALYHPDHYEKPVRFGHFPPIRHDGY